MPDVNYHLFLPVLAAALLTIINDPDEIIPMPETPSPEAKSGLWVLDADERNATDMYSTMRVWDAEPLDHSPEWIHVQVATLGMDVVEAIARAALIANALCDDDGEPRAFWVIGENDAWTVVGIPSITVPRSIGKDGNGRSEVVFDFEIVFRPTTAE